MKEFEILLNIIKEEYKISKEDLLSKIRKREFVELRYVCVNILSILEVSNEEISNLIKIDRTTLYNATKLHKNSINSDNSYYKKFEFINSSFLNIFETPERIRLNIESLELQKKTLEEKIERLEFLYNSKLN